MISYHEKEGKILEPEKLIEIENKYDVIVAGGGMAGVGAAIATARAGCKTLMIERESALGGLATVGLVNIPLDYLSGIGAEMFKRLEAVNGLWHHHSDPEKHKLVLDRMVKEAGCDVLFATQIVDAIVQNNAIRGVVVESKSGRKAILAGRVVDCSGDGDAAYFAGCEYHLGSPDHNGYTQGCSVEFRLGGVDYDKYLASELKSKDPRWTRIIEKAVAAGQLPYPIDDHLNWMTHLPGRPEHCGKDEVSICLAHSRNCRPLDNHDLTRMYFEGREQCDMLSNFIRKNIPGFKNSWLIDTAALLGVRDSRRITGEYILTGYDVARRAKFDDVIAISWRAYDIHNPTGPGNLKYATHEIDGKKRYIAADHTAFASTPPPGGYEALCDYQGRTGDDLVFAFDEKENKTDTNYDVPYRSLVPLKIDNLLVAGRCLSADFCGQSATRLIMCCNSMGEAAGTAAAISLKKNITPRQVNRVELQKKLLAHGGKLSQGRNIPGL